MNSYSSAQSYQGDKRNDDALVYLNGEFVHRDKATISIFDSGFVLGDGIWEGIRLVDGKLLSLEAHLDRLFEGARAISLDIGMSREELTEALMETCRKNGFETDTHIRMMISRGRKSTPNQDPRFLVGKATIVIVAEIKRPRVEFSDGGLKLFTSTYRCSSPDVFDLRLNSHSRLNLIQALVQAIAAGADEALMLDPNGFVASCNSTNFFMIRKGELWTSTGRWSFNGITRGHIVRLFGEELGMARETDFTLAQAYSADEAFVTGTLGGVTPVSKIDGHVIADGKPGPLTRRIGEIYWAYTRRG